MILFVLFTLNACTIYDIPKEAKKAFFEVSNNDRIYFDFDISQQIFVFSNSTISYTFNSFYIDGIAKMGIGFSDGSHGVAFLTKSGYFIAKGISKVVIYILPYGTCYHAVAGFGGVKNSFELKTILLNKNSCTFFPTFENETEAQFTIGKSNSKASGTYKLIDIDTGETLKKTSSSASVKTNKHVYGLHELSPSLYEHKFVRKYSKVDETFSESCVEAEAVSMCSKVEGFIRCEKYYEDVAITSTICSTSTRKNAASIVFPIIFVIIVIVLLMYCGVFSSCGIGPKFACCTNKKDDDKDEESGSVA